MGAIQSTMNSEVPCYRCLFMTPIKARKCNPTKCDKINNWLIALKNMACPFCGSTRLVKAGCSNKSFSKGGHQLYKCRQCGRRFRPGFAYKKKNRKQVIEYARMLASQDEPAFSTRDIAKEIRLKFQIDISHTAVWEWIKSGTPTTNRHG